MGQLSLRLDTTATNTLTGTNLLPIINTAPTQSGFHPEAGVGAVGTAVSDFLAYAALNVGPLTTRTTADLGTTQDSTPTAAQLLGGIVTQTGETGAGTVTTPTGAVLSAAVTGVAVGVTFETVFANLGGGQTLTITAGASGMTIVGTADVPSGTCARLTFTNTDTDTWICYVNVSA